MESRERDLSSVKELIGPLCGNGFDEDAVGGAGDEVADVFVAAQRGHGAAIGGAGGVGGEDFVDAGALGALEAGIVGALPGGAAALDGGAGFFGVGLERRVWSGCNQIQCGFWEHGGFSV